MLLTPLLSHTFFQRKIRQGGKTTGIPFRKQFPLEHDSTVSSMSLSICSLQGSKIEIALNSSLFRYVKFLLHFLKELRQAVYSRPEIPWWQDGVLVDISVANLLSRSSLLSFLSPLHPVTQLLARCPLINLYGNYLFMFQSLLDSLDHRVLEDSELSTYWVLNQRGLSSTGSQKITFTISHIETNTCRHEHCTHLLWCHAK